MIVKDGNKSYMTANKANDYIIPNEYQEVEYIESNGTQWIDTLHIPSTEIKIAGKVSKTFFTNQGTGEFLYGNPISNIKLMEEMN